MRGSCKVAEWRLSARDIFFTKGVLQGCSFAVLCIFSWVSVKLLLCWEKHCTEVANMGKAKKTRKFAEVKRMLNPKDQRLQVVHATPAICLSPCLEKVVSKSVSLSIFFKWWWRHAMLRTLSAAHWANGNQTHEAHYRKRRCVWYKNVVDPCSCCVAHSVFVMRLIALLWMLPCPWPIEKISCCI